MIEQATERYVDDLQDCIRRFDLYSKQLRDLQLRWAYTYRSVSVSNTEKQILIANPYRIWMSVRAILCPAQSGTATPFSMGAFNVNMAGTKIAAISPTPGTSSSGIPLCGGCDCIEAYQTKDGPRCTSAWYATGVGNQTLLVEETVWSGYPGKDGQCET